MLIVLANLFIYKGALEKNKISTIIGIILLFLAMATYQSFIAIYIAICIICFVLVVENESIKMEKFDIIKLILFVSISFIIAFVAYQIVLRIFSYKISNATE